MEQCNISMINALYEDVVSEEMPEAALEAMMKAMMEAPLGSTVIVHNIKQYACHVSCSQCM